MNRPITSGDFDPLRMPGTIKSTPQVGPSFSAGQFVRAAINNTAFFKTLPKGDSDADKLLDRGTSMKVISHSESYVKVELDSGEIGWVPIVMLEDPNAPQPSSTIPNNPNEIQVYPLPGTDQIPVVPPSAQPPDGAIPTVIDPETPPPVKEPFAAPEPNKEPAPLPPNGKDE